MNKYKNTFPNNSLLQVIGNLCKDSSLIETSGLTLEDVSKTNGHAVVFNVIYDNYYLGITHLTPQDIYNCLTDRPKSLKEFESLGGIDFIKSAIQSCNNDAFPSSVTALKKYTLIRKYGELGMDLSDFIDENELDGSIQAEKQEKLNRMTLAQLENEIEKKIDDVKNNYVYKYEDDTDFVGKDIYQLVENLQITPSVGIPMSGKYLNSIFMGLRLNKFYLFSAPTGMGKALPNSTKIPTPNGWTTVDKVKTGDLLFDQHGKPTKVLRTFPQGEKEVYKITFKDGRTALCCKDHLWTYHCLSSKRNPNLLKTSTTQELIDQYGSRKYKGSGYLIGIPYNEPVEYKKKEYSISPYVMGLLLGDGSFRYSQNQKALSFSSIDEELPSIIATEFHVDYKKSSDHNYNYTFGIKGSNLWVTEVLKEYPDLWNVKSENKFIPKEYLQGNITQRFDLLAGLMDTDGSIDEEKGRCGFTTISPFLRDNFIELCQSLGMSATYGIDKRKEKYTTGECYNIHIECKPEMKEQIFKIKRKKDRVKKWLNNGKRKEHKQYLPIINIERLSYKEKMTCFLVDNEEHLFLMNDFIVTHNTRFLVSQACHTACSEFYDITKRQWIKNNHTYATLYITIEQELEEVQTMCLAFISGVPEDHIIMNQYQGDEWTRVQKACKILDNANLMIKELPDFSLKDVEFVIKRNIKESNIEYVFFDYIATSIGILAEVQSSTGVRLREDQILLLLSTKLKDICNKYGVFIMSATQVNAEGLKDRMPGVNALRGSKAIADKIDAGSIMTRVTKEDLDSLQGIMEKFPYDPPDIKICVYKNRRSRYKDIIIWCNSQLSTCNINPICVTNQYYELLNIEELKINVS